MDSVDERDWIEQAQQGDRAAFGEMVRRYQTAVYNIAYRMLGRRRDAEDAAQEAFLRAYRGLDRFDATRPFAPWIKRITVNVCLNRLEAGRIRPHTLASEMTGFDGDRADLDTWAHTAPTPEQTVLSREQTERIRAAITRLPPRYRAVIELRHFQELSYQAMAEALGRPLNTVKSDLYRARKMLAQQLQEMA